MKARQKNKQAEKFEFIFKIEKFYNDLPISEFQIKILKCLRQEGLK